LVATGAVLRLVALIDEREAGRGGAGAGGVAASKDRSSD
jgi:hypothetical protein